MLKKDRKKWRRAKRGGEGYVREKEKGSERERERERD